MLERLTVQDFASLLNQIFTLQAAPEVSWQVELVEVTPLGNAPSDESGRRQPFSLIFRGPRQPVLPQMIYPIANAALGEMEIFLVPIGPDEVGLRYEAVFN